MAWSTVHEELLKKLNQEMEEYQKQMWSMTGSQVYALADEIAAMKFCYNQLVGHLHDYQVEDLEWLMGYMKPLEAMCSHWQIEQDIDLESEFDRIFRDWGYEEEPESGMDMPSIS